MSKYAIVLGTRPEIIKCSPIIRALSQSKKDFLIIHTNQHYSENMDKVFFKELELPEPKYNLRVQSGTQAIQTGDMLQKLEPVLINEKPDCVLVQGDTNTVLAGALTACKLGINIAHVEAGLRSYDRTMPEEINRIITDHISNYLFAPTDKQADILRQEGIEESKIYKVGNTIVDAVLQNRQIAKRRINLLRSLRCQPNNFILLTCHRPANVDYQENLLQIISAADKVSKHFKKSIIFPIHPRTKKNLNTFKIKIPVAFKLIEPVGYLAMLQLIENTFLVMTDSGGIQEEACVLRKKCIVLRRNTERPETLETGGTILGGTTTDSIYKASIELILSKEVNWGNPFGDGRTGERICRVLSRI